METGSDSTHGSSGQSPGNDDAVFTGWQTMTSGESIALYTITAAGHPSRGSTVTHMSLLRLNLKIPQTPGPPGSRS